MNKTKKSTFEILGLPESVGPILFIISLIFLLGPYFAGMDLGIFKIPTFSEDMSRWLKIIGPVALILTIFLFIPIWKKRDSIAQHKTQLESSLNLYEKHLERYTTDEDIFYPGVRSPLDDELGMSGMSGSVIDERFRGKTVEAIIYELMEKSSNKEVCQSLKDNWQELVDMDYQVADDDISKRVELVAKAKSKVEKMKKLIKNLE